MESTQLNQPMTLSIYDESSGAGLKNQSRRQGAILPLVASPEQEEDC
jgi:hypothetical protein